MVVQSTEWPGPCLDNSDSVNGHKTHMSKNAALTDRYDPVVHLEKERALANGLKPDQLQEGKKGNGNVDQRHYASYGLVPDDNGEAADGNEHSGRDQGGDPGPCQSVGRHSYL